MFRTSKDGKERWFSCFLRSFAYKRGPKHLAKCFASNLTTCNSVIQNLEIAHTEDVFFFSKWTVVWIQIFFILSSCMWWKILHGWLYVMLRSPWWRIPPLWNWCRGVFPQWGNLTKDALLYQTRSVPNIIMCSAGVLHSAISTYSSAIFVDMNFSNRVQCKWK